VATVIELVAEWPTGGGHHGHHCQPLLLSLSLCCSGGICHVHFIAIVFIMVVVVVVVVDAPPALVMVIVVALRQLGSAVVRVQTHTWELEM